jgi:peptide/nickel transport system permease protein
MGRFIVRRLVGMIAVLFAISIIVFVIFNVLPSGDPARRIAGRQQTPEQIRQINKDFGFDQSLPVQYERTMKQVFTGTLISYSDRTNVLDRIKQGLPATFSLAIGAAVIWMAFALVFGYLSAVKAGRFTDRALTILSLIGISMPVFLIGAVLLLYLTFKTQIFPPAGYVGLTVDPWQWFTHLVLPWVSLAILYIGFYSRVLRSNMLDVMNEDYVRTARAKGLSERQVRIRHVFRNSLIPVITLFGLDFGAVIGGGAIITEYVFSLNGVGQYAAQSINQQDLPPVMAVVMLGAFFIVFFNTLVDIAYAWLDPRIRLGTAAA